MKKKGQEEMVGFALIIIIVSIILIIFLAISLNKPKRDTVNSYEVENFLQVMLQYNTNCSTYNEDYVSIQRLITECTSNSICSDGTSSCKILNSTLNEIISESWKVDGNRPLKGYQFSVKSEGKDLIAFEKGNITNNYKGASQEFKKVEIFLTTYY